MPLTTSSDEAGDSTDFWSKVALISCCSGLCCCLFITAITMLWYNPMTSVTILGVMLIVCCVTGVLVGTGRVDKEEVSSAEQGRYP